MIGRLLTALIADLLSWRYALGAIGLIGVSRRSSRGRRFRRRATSRRDDST
jgi:hypothetical protein